MKKHFCVTILLFTFTICGAQNLVPNGDFEQYSGCPNALIQLDSALFWRSATSATPDYFNACANPSFVGVPSNIGVQNAYSGDGYSGIYLWYQLASIREYIEVPLLSPLVANQCYHFEMYINLSEYSSYSTYSIGAYLSDTLFIDYSTLTTLPLVAQIQNDSLNVPDFINWTLVSGDYTAHGGESYLILGNFKDDANTPVTLTPNAGNNLAYVYIENVSLLTCVSIGISEQANNSDVTIYPNPVTCELSIATIHHEQSEIILYDITSVKLLQQAFINSTTLNLEQLASGIYIYEVRNKNGAIKKGKVVKQ